LLGIYEKLETEGRKQVRDYAAERLDLQIFRNEQERAFNEGLQYGKQKRSRAKTPGEEAAQNAPEDTTLPLEAPQEAKGEEGTA
jgi:hypothetical protein